MPYSEKILNIENYGGKNYKYNKIENFKPDTQKRCQFSDIWLFYDSYIENVNSLKFFFKTFHSFSQKVLKISRFSQRKSYEL